MQGMKFLGYKVSLLMLLVLFAGCGGKKLSLLDNSGNIITKTQQQLVVDVLDNELEFNTLTTKGKVQFGGKEYATVFKLIKDSILQASVRPMLGIELIRLDITPSRITLIDRLGSQYAIVDMDPINQASLAFNFYNLQALLTNKLFIPGQATLTKDDYKKFTYVINQNNYILNIEDKNAVKYDFWIDNLNRISSIFIAHATFPASMVWKYYEFVEDDAKNIYPTQIKVQVQYEKLDTTFGVSYNKLDVDKDFSVDISIPKKYTQRNIKEILSGYVKK